MLVLGINNLAAFQAGVGNASPFLAIAFDRPAAAAANQSQGASLAPPFVDFSREGEPDVTLGANLAEVLQKLSIYGLWSFLDDIVGMNEKTDQSVSCSHHFDFALPQGDRVVLQNVEERVVLRGSYGKLQHVAYKIRHDCATPAALRVQMCRVRH